MSKKQVFKFATNHLNLALMLSAGVVLDKDSLNTISKGKYYKDSLSWFDGFVPVFNKVPMAALDEAIDEDKDTLRPSVVEFDKAVLAGLDKVFAFVNGAWQEMTIHDKQIMAADCLLLPAPINLAGAKIYFNSDDDLSIFKERINDSANIIDLPAKNIKVTKSEFNHKGKFELGYLMSGSLFGSQIKHATNLYYQANAITAIIHHLMVLANTNQSAFELLQFIKTGNNKDNKTDNNLLNEIGGWIRNNGDISGVKDKTIKSFIHICQNLIQLKYDKRFGSNKDILLYSLEEMSGGKSTEFIDELRGLLGFSSLTLDELLQKHDTPLRRAMTLFIGFNSADELWQNTIIKTPLSMLDMLFASIFFAVSIGYQALPKSYKTYAGKADNLQAILTQIAQGISLEAHNEHIQKITAVLHDVWQKSSFTGKLKALIIYMNETYHWQCIEEEIVICDDVNMSIKAGKIILKGKPNSIKIQTHIDIANVRAYLSAMPILNAQHYQELQNIYDKAK